VLRLRDLIFDSQPAQAHAVLDAWLDDAAKDPAAGCTRGDYAKHLRTEFSTFRWLPEPMLTAVGSTIVTAGLPGLELRRLISRKSRSLLPAAASPPPPATTCRTAALSPARAPHPPARVPSSDRTTADASAGRIRLMAAAITVAR